jgi:predicted NUDIX family phosphoesterase
MDELVYVVPRAALMGDPGWHGLRTGNVGAHLEAIGGAGRFAPRGPMERDRSFKQVIPYLVLRDDRQIFLMRRTRAGADERLHERFSIGVGGHLNPGDGDLSGGLRREWREELVAGFEPEFRFLGLLNDDTTDVGSVHVGAVYLTDAAGRPVAVRETDKLTGAFASPDEAWAVHDRMETWSQLVLEAIAPRAASAR